MFNVTFSETENFPVSFAKEEEKSVELREAFYVPVPGEKGDPGESPTVKVFDITNGHRIVITDIDGAHSFDVMNGEQGIQGIQGERGVQGIQGERGERGEQGIQGIQGERGIQGIQGERGIQGEQGIQGIQGEQGIQGIQGEPGKGVAQGGTVGQILMKSSATDYDTEWTPPMIPFGRLDSTSTATNFTATVPGITELKDGVCVILKNGVITSASGVKLNINNLGAKPMYSSMAAATAVTTVFNVNYTLLLVYDETRVADGCWVVYYGYYSDSNSIAYQVRTNSSTRPAAAKFYRYRLLFESADGKKWIPANTSTSTNATASRTVNQTPINPFGDIAYYGTTTAIEANANVTAAQLWQQYTLTLGYSFNRTGAALVLPYPSPIYLKCAPQSDGSAIIDADEPYVFSLPSTNDGKIYIYLGRTYSATNIELVLHHPVYYHDGTRVRLWT